MKGRRLTIIKKTGPARGSRRRGGEAPPDNSIQELKLLNAARNGNLNVVTQLLTNGVNPTTPKHPEKYTALMFAAEKGNNSMINMLLKKKAAVDATNSEKKTALMLAAESGHESTVDKLVEARAKVNAADEYGQTALMRAAKKGHKSTVKKLLNKGANVDLEDNFELTALNLAKDNLTKDNLTKDKEYRDIVNILEAASKQKEATTGGRKKHTRKHKKHHK